MSKKLIISITINVLMISILAVISWTHYSKASTKKTTSDVLRPAHYEQRKSLFESLTISPNDTVMLGDSMVLYNEWQEFFDVPIVNRGIGGDTTSGLLRRLHTITEGQPKRVVLMIGINDISRNVPQKKTVLQYEKVLTQIQHQSPNTKIYTMSVLPVNNDIYGERVHNDDVIAFNKKIMHLSKKYNATFIDIYRLYEQRGQLKKSYTNDGLHLNGQGYEIWVNALKPYFYEKKG